MFNFSLTDFASAIQTASCDYLSGPPIKVSVAHKLTPEEVKLKIMHKAQSVPSEFLPEYEWNEYRCTFSGCAEGLIVITEDEVHITAQLSVALGIFYNKVENDLPIKLRLLLDDHFEDN